MGNILSSDVHAPWRRLPCFRPARVMLLGLDFTGKTTLFNTLALSTRAGTSSVKATNHGTGCRLENLQLGRLTLSSVRVGVHDPGGYGMWVRDMVRENADGAIWIVDTSDPDCPEDVFYEMGNMWLRVEETKGRPILMMVNHGIGEPRQSLKEIEMRTQAALDKHDRGDQIFAVRSISAKTGNGVYEGLGWLVDEINLSRSSKSKLKVSSTKFPATAL